MNPLKTIASIIKGARANLDEIRNQIAALRTEREDIGFEVLPLVESTDPGCGEGSPVLRASAMLGRRARCRRCCPVPCHFSKFARGWRQIRRVQRRARLGGTRLEPGKQSQE